MVGVAVLEVVLTRSTMIASFKAGRPGTLLFVPTTDFVNADGLLIRLVAGIAGLVTVVAGTVGLVTAAAGTAGLDMPSFLNVGFDLFTAAL